MMRSELSPCAWMNVSAPLEDASIWDSMSPSRSVTTMSGTRCFITDSVADPAEITNSPSNPDISGDAGPMMVTLCPIMSNTSSSSMRSAICINVFRSLAEDSSDVRS